MGQDVKPYKGHLYYPKNLDGGPAYIFKGVDSNSDLTFVADFSLHPRSFLRKVLKFLFVGRIPLPGRLVEWITGYKGYHWLTTLKQGDRLLVNGVTNLHTLQAIKWLTPKNVRCFQYFNNCLRFVIPANDVGSRIAKMQQMGYNLVTFDPEEANNYNMTYAPQFYRFPEPYNAEIKYDFFFCGLSKDRGQHLLELKSQLESLGFSCLFIVVDDLKSGISYKEYLEHVKESRCLVDVFQENQVGLTRRPMEALFFNKKLLTENRSIISFDFYRPENIYLLEQDNIDGITHFMKNVEMTDVPDEVKRRYDVNTWLKFFA